MRFELSTSDRIVEGCTAAPLWPRQWFAGAAQIGCYRPSKIARRGAEEGHTVGRWVRGFGGTEAAPWRPAMITCSSAAPASTGTRNAGRKRRERGLGRFPKLTSKLVVVTARGGDAAVD